MSIYVCAVGLGGACRGHGRIEAIQLVGAEFVKLGPVEAREPLHSVFPDIGNQLCTIGAERGVADRQEEMLLAEPSGGDGDVAWAARSNVHHQTFDFAELLAVHVFDAHTGKRPAAFIEILGL